jgi:hypothetical protein
MSTGVSNGLLQQWPKVQKGLSTLLQCLGLEPHHINNDASQSQPQSQSQCTAASGDDTANGRPAGSSSGVRLADPGAEDCAAMHCAAATEPGAAGGDAPSHPAGCGGNGGSSSSSSSSSAELPWDALFHHVMGDKRKAAAGEELPLTGVGEDTDRRLSSIFVEPFDMQVGLWTSSATTMCM